MRNPLVSFLIRGFVGGARGIRTPDLLIANETRYQLRHRPSVVMTRITGPRSPVGVAGLLEIIEQLVEQFEPLGTAAGDVGGLQEGGQGRIAVPAGPGAHGSAGALKDVKACRDVPGVDGGQSGG